MARLAGLPEPPDEEDLHPVPFSLPGLDSHGSPLTHGEKAKKRKDRKAQRQARKRNRKR
jgi:hypothetical protein